MAIFFDENSGISIELKASLGWTNPNQYPEAVCVQHDCCEDIGVIYLPERTCRVVSDEAKSPIDGKTIVLYKCSECRDLVSLAMNYCPGCGCLIEAEE